jgi:hypothetical protein
MNLILTDFRLFAAGSVDLDAVVMAGDVVCTLMVF